MSAEIKLEGLDEIIDQLSKIGNQANVDKALGKACAIVEKSARKKAPKDHGKLRRSITSKVEDNKVIVYTPLEYAPYVEYGTGLFAEGGGRMDVPWCYEDDRGKWHTTSGQKPQPFMRPALNENRARILKMLKEELTKCSTTDQP
jgi:HK97 gp10 family phage protein